ncbi:phosphatase [uncultured Veillonella sp.]|uniref:Ppx/GppA phosphatase family protein n=1 Tax=uncultured Veillonella sp. TaxID=159268 RepID=UPI002620C4C5|nr:phosphatase [uncultured Veillonella sp.]
MTDTKVAIIDLGSNSFRLLLGEYKHNEWHNEPKILWRTRLGARHEDGRITEEAWQGGLQALQEIHSLIEAFGATKVIALATSAIREAPNGAEFMEAAGKICPMEGRILTGEEEAQYGFIGAIGQRLQDGRHYAIIDIGGGSTEVALGFLDEVYWSRSYPMGAVRLQQASEEDPQAVWRETQPWFDPLPIKGNFGEFVAIGGTATTLAAMDLKMTDYDSNKIQDHRLTREAVELMIMDLRNMSYEERCNVPGLQLSRADIIVAGAEILTSFMDTYEIPSVLVSERDGMEGIEESLVDHK